MPHAACGVHPLAIQKSNIAFATELVVFNVYELEVEVDTLVVADEADEIDKASENSYLRIDRTINEYRQLDSFK